MLAEVCCVMFRPPKDRPLRSCEAAKLVQYNQWIIMSRDLDLTKVIIQPAKYLPSSFIGRRTAKISVPAAVGDNDNTH